MKMLSTPTAKTRKGTTSIMMSVAGTPQKLYTPRDAMTERKTRTTPARPSAIFEWICKKKINSKMQYTSYYCIITNP